MTPEQRIARGEQADDAMTRFLRPAFEVVIADYMARLTELAAEKPYETDKIRKLAAGVKIARTVQSQVEAVVQDGQAALLDKRRAEKLENMPDAKRRWALAAGGY